MEGVRYISNPNLTSPVTLQEEQITQYFDELISNFEQNYPIDSDLMISSIPKKSRPSFDIYCGSGGKAFLYFKLSRRDKSYQEKFNSSLDACLNLLKHFYKTKKLREDQTPLSFFFGDIGIYALAAVKAADQNNATLVNQYIQNMLTREQWIYTEVTQDEVLYGNAGYLYAFLFVYKYCNQQIQNQKQIITICNKIIKELIKIGWNTKGKLIYQFPRGQDHYIGAAHGTIGIIQTFLLAFLAIPELVQSVTEIQNTLDYLISIQFQSGNFPVTSDEIEEENDTLVHFCHGAAGFIMTLCLAYSFFQKQTYLESALKAGEDIWNRGLLKKGNGLCHGISGNAYPFITLYKTTGDSKWLQRAHTFATLQMDERIKQAQSQYFDLQRMKQGVPDTPLSLMEGLAGCIAFYWDLLDTKSSAFPGYEL